MPVSINFYRVSEKKPEHKQQIYHLKPDDSLYHQGYTLVESLVEWSLNEVDFQGDPTGACVDWSDDNTEHENWVLAIESNGVEMSEDDLWISSEEFWESVCVD